MPTALIAEDEELLAAHLRQELAALWPELRIVATAPHGTAAVELALQHQPDLCFLDIRMPGQTGLEAAEQLAEDWPEGRPLPLLVFVTAYDQYALQAFERAAVDYVLKPVQRERLAQTVQRLQQALAQRQGAQGPAQDAVLAQLRALLGSPAAGQVPAAATLRHLQVGVGSGILMLPLDEVLYLEAADKYLRVQTADKDYLVRVSLRELLPQLDPQRFWQIHRGTIVQVDAIHRLSRDDNGKLTLHLRQRPETLGVSRMYAHLFKAL